MTETFYGVKVSVGMSRLLAVVLQSFVGVLVRGVEAVFAAVIGQLGFAVEHVGGGVVGSVLLVTC